MQVSAGPVHAASASGSSYDLGLADLEGLVLMVSSLLSGFYTLLPPLFFGGGESLSTEKRGLMDTSHFEVCVPRNLSLSFYIISDGRSLDLFSSAPGESFSDDG